jgi:hypothetical protein
VKGASSIAQRGRVTRAGQSRGGNPPHHVRNGGHEKNGVRGMAKHTISSHDIRHRRGCNHYHVVEKRNVERTASSSTLKKLAVCALPALLLHDVSLTSSTRVARHSHSVGATTGNSGPTKGQGTCRQSGPGTARAATRVHPRPQSLRPATSMWFVHNVPFLRGPPFLPSQHTVQLFFSRRCVATSITHRVLSVEPKNPLRLHTSHIMHTRQAV